MSINRRGFFAASATAAAAVSLPQTLVAADEIQTKAKPEAVLKLSSQLSKVIPGDELPEKLAFMEKCGFDGVEFRGDIVGNEKMHEDAVKNTNLKVSAICLGSLDGSLVSDVPSKRAAGIAKLKEVITSAGALKSTGVVYVPAFNSETTRTNKEIREILVDILPEIGEHAVKAGTRVVMEPLNRNESFFIRQVADAASIARDCKSAGIGVMGDFYHMFFEETSDLGAFISGGSYVHHVHLASRVRNLPGQDERQFVDGFRGLKWIGYHDFCSFECAVQGDRAVEVPKSMAFLRDQWAKA